MGGRPYGGQKRRDTRSEKINRHDVWRDDDGHASDNAPHRENGAANLRG